MIIKTKNLQWVSSIFVYIYARYTRPASELYCLRFNLSELLILWQGTSCGNLQGNFYDNPIQSLHSRRFQNLVIHISITNWKFLNFKTFYYAVDPDIDEPNEGRQQLCDPAWDKTK